MKTCLVCDDHQMLREALIGAVRLGWPDVVVSEAGDFPTAWSLAAAAPDLILCDLVMPGAQPAEGIAGLIAAAPATPILVVTGNEEDRLLRQIYGLGVAGVLPKTSRTAIIESVIRLVLAGEFYLPARLKDLFLGGATAASATGYASRLTPRQIDVLRRMARGLTNKDIAREIDLSPATVQSHAAAIFAALEVSNRTEAVVRAQALGLL